MRSISEEVRAIIVKSIKADTVYKKKELVDISRSGYAGEKSDVTDGIVTGAVRELCNSGYLKALEERGMYCKGSGDSSMSLDEKVKVVFKNFIMDLGLVTKSIDSLTCSDGELEYLLKLRKVVPKVEDVLKDIMVDINKEVVTPEQAESKEPEDKKEGNSKKK